MKESILCLLIRVLTFIFRLLPIQLSLFIGRAFGMLGYFLSPKRAGIAYRNLRCAFGHKYSPSQLRAFARGCFCNLGMNFIETLCIEKIDKRYVDKYIEFEGYEHWDKAIEKGKGAILLTGHVGNWELSSIASGVKGYKVFPVARAQMGPKVTKLLYSYREKKGATVIDKEGALRKMLTVLKNGGVIGLLLDQDAGVTGGFADLFGRLASVRREPLLLGMKKGTAIIPVFMQRKHGPYHILKMHPPIDYSSLGAPEEAVDGVIKQFNGIITERVQDYPAQWLWAHKRWKSTPTRKVVVLDDGKAGHLNQSKAIAQTVGESISSDGRKYADIKTVRTEFKSKTARGLFTMFYRCARLCRPLRFALLKHALTAQSYRDIAGLYADVVISTGSALSALTLFMKEENKAKAIICFKPQGACVQSFDLVVLGEHDADKVNAEKGNVVLVNGALSFADKDKLKEGLDSLMPLLRQDAVSDSAKNVGVFVGGDTGSFSITADDIKRLFDSLESAAEDENMKFIITTSRRTSKEVEGYLKERFADSSRCKLLIIANEKNPDNAVSGILALSDAVVATADSISMVSEAAASEAPVIVYKNESFSDLSKKHICIVDKFAKNNIIRLCPAQEAGEKLVKLLRGEDKTVVLDNKAVLREAIDKTLS